MGRHVRDAATETLQGDRRCRQDDSTERARGTGRWDDAHEMPTRIRAAGARTTRSRGARGFRATECVAKRSATRSLREASVREVEALYACVADVRKV